MNQPAVASRLFRSAHSYLVRVSLTRLRAVTFLLLVGASALGYSQEVRFAAIQTTPILQRRTMKPRSGAATSSQVHRTVMPGANATRILKTMNSGSGIVFTCDTGSGMTAATCNYLNTTVAGYYNSTFTDANANIYVQYGTTGLGESLQYLNLVSYSSYVAALTANTNKSTVQSDGLAAINTYAATPYGGGDVEVTTALGTALGFSGMTGITPDGGSCTPGTSGCYNVIITVTNDPGTPLYYDNLGGSEPSDAYDFYAVVQHEVDESLGTSSCITTDTDPLSDGCDFDPDVPTGVPSAVDLFRFSSPGNLALDTDPSTTAGQYFSYNGGTDYGAYGLAGTFKVYNTGDNGADFADFAEENPCGTNESIQDAYGCPGADGGLTILNDGLAEVTILNAVGYDIASSGPAVSLSTTSLSFPSTEVGSTSTLSVTITNSGSGTLAVTKIGNTGTNPTDFTHTSNCGGNPLSAGSSCTAKVSFTPTTAGSFSAVLNITDNASNSPQTVTLTGTATAGPAVTFSATSLSFPSTEVGSTSTIALTITNSGGATLNVTAIGNTGTDPTDFSHTSNCGGNPIAPGGQCTAEVSFTPTAAGSFSAVLNITDNAPNSPQNLTLSGTAVAGPAVTLSATSLSFPSTEVGSTSTIALTITNSGGATLNVTAIGNTGTDPANFSHTSNCGGNPIAPGGHCTAEVSFTPTATGSFSAVLNITDNATGSPQKVALSGTGGSAPAVTLSSTSLSFPETAIGSTSTMSLTITNSGGSTLNVTSIGNTGTTPADFSHTSNCGGNPIAPGGHCTAEVSFTPTATGSFSATLNISDNATGSPQTVMLSGTGN